MRRIPVCSRATSAGPSAPCPGPTLKAVSATFADVPGGPRGYQVLAAAAREEPGSQLALAQHLGVDRTVMTYLLDSLAEAGLVERHPDPADRRARRIVATARGRALLDGLDERLRAAEDQLLAGLDDDADRQTFRALLQRVAVHAASALDAAAPDGAARSLHRRALLAAAKRNQRRRRALA